MTIGEPWDRRNEMKEEMLATIPGWSRFDTDVGLVYLANPVVVRPRQNVKLPWRRQYYMRPEAKMGIAFTIEGVIAAGVLVETRSNCNTPLLPVLKADKQKWRLVQDLRAVNDDFLLRKSFYYFCFCADISVVTFLLFWPLLG